MDSCLLPVTEMNVFRLGEICIELAPAVFEALGAAPAAAVEEISESLTEMPIDTSARELRSFRTGDFSYQILKYFRHTDNSVGSEHFYVDFEVRLGRAAETLLCLSGGASGHSSRGDYWDTITVSELKAVCADRRWLTFAENFVQKINETADKDM